MQTGTGLLRLADQAAEGRVTPTGPSWSAGMKAARGLGRQCRGFELQTEEAQGLLERPTTTVSQQMHENLGVGRSAEDGPAALDLELTGVDERPIMHHSEVPVGLLGDHGLVVTLGTVTDVSEHRPAGVESLQVTACETGPARLIAWIRPLAWSTSRAGGLLPPVLQLSGLKERYKRQVAVVVSQVVSSIASKLRLSDVRFRMQA